MKTNIIGLKRATATPKLVIKPSIPKVAPKPVESKHAYRFKTVAELEAEFGVDFRNNKKLNWNRYIEAFFGKEFDRSIRYNILPFKAPNGMGVCHGYYVTADLLTVANQKLADAYMKEPKYLVKLENAEDNLSTVMVNNVSVFLIDHDPTGNCQVGSFLDFGGLANQVTKVEEIAEIFRQLCSLVDKKLYIIDIKSYLVKDYGWDKLPGLVMLNPYESTNGSKMYLGLIHIQE